jgi:hypothetical protein
MNYSIENRRFSTQFLGLSRSYRESATALDWYGALLSSADVLPNSAIKYRSSRLFVRMTYRTYQKPFSLCQRPCERGFPATRAGSCERLPSQLGHPVSDRGETRDGLFQRARLVCHVLLIETNDSLTVVYRWLARHYCSTSNTAYDAPVQRSPCRKSGAAPDGDNKLSPPEIRRCTATTTLCERRSPVKRMPRPSPSIAIRRDAQLRFAIEPERLNMAGSCSREFGCLLGTPVEPERASRREQAL